MKERVNNLSCILADLQGKVKNANEEKDSLITAMKLLVEDLNNKGNGTNLNRDEETEQSSLQMTNDIQQTNNPNKVSKTVFHPRINLSNRFSFDENDRSDQDTVESETERTYTITQQSTQTRGKITTQGPEEVSDTEHRAKKMHTSNLFDGENPGPHLNTLPCTSNNIVIKHNMQTQSVTYKPISNSGAVSADSQRNQYPKLKGFSFAQLNITSLTKHIEELRILINEMNFDILCINERRLDKTIKNSEIGLQRYDLTRRDRNRNGGGVAIIRT